MLDTANDQEYTVVCEICKREEGYPHSYFGAVGESCLAEAEFALVYGPTEQYNGTPAPRMNKLVARQILYPEEQ